MTPDEIRLQIVLALVQEPYPDEDTLIAAAQKVAAFVLDEPPPQ